MDREEPKMQASARMLSYDISSVDSYEPLNEVTTKKRHRRALWERLIGTAAVAVR
jgi:hypothetical protein